jgi:hypothetical protein
MDARIEQLTLEMERRPPALAELAQFCASGDFTPPTDYIEFMGETDGAEGNVGNAYFRMYGTQEMTQCNTVNQSIEPGLLFFATNLGGEGYAFDLALAETRIIAVEFVTLDRTEADYMGSTSLEFLEILARRAG